MKKPLSQMTAQEFVEIMAALGLNGRTMAQALNRSPSLITRYMNGSPIPVEIVHVLNDLLKAKRQEIELAAGVANATVGAMILFNNGRKRPELHQTLGRFGRRQRKPDTRLLPKYRMTRERMAIYLEALSRWQQHVRQLAATYNDEARQRDYQLEFHDIRAMAASAPRAMPYDVYIERSQWDVVSRALRHLATDPEFYARAHALRTHWGKHRFSGYLARRRYPKFKPTEGESHA